MNVLIIGFGAAGRFYFDLLKKDKKIKKIYVNDKIKLPLNKKYTQIKIEKIIKEDLFINYAFICSPSHLHYYYADICLKNNMSVLIEKPFVLKLEHATKLIKLSKNKKLKCWTALQNRHNKATSEMRKNILSKKIGEIVVVDCSMFWHRDKKYYKNNWRGKYFSDGGVLNNQAIHLLDALIYTIGPIKHFDVLARYNKKKLEAEDLIVINFKHINGAISSLKATTRADQDYRSSIDVIGTKGRLLVKGISLNTFSYWKKTKKGSRSFQLDSASEDFKRGMGPKSGMGNGHQKILIEFLNKKTKKSSRDLEISKNIYVLKIIHSIYNNLSKKIKLNKIKDTPSILGANEKK
jgi:UDP-N-acetyl-2-amino-2-deoxyglucuronate dehydrogenase